MEKILLNDLLCFNSEECKKVKIRFNQPSDTDDPMELYQQNPEHINNRWLFWRREQRYFNVGQIAICLLKLTNDTWLLTTIKEVTKELNVLNGINYEGKELERVKPYFGRVIIKYHKTSQSQGRNYEGICDELEVQQILPVVFDGEDFPGYDNVRLSFQQLESILTRGKRDWMAALRNQKAVYLITDKNTGKMYVGSATSASGMLLNRWKSYVENGHGGNVELCYLVENEGFDYIKRNFEYSILENYNSKVDDHIILKRETWWKETLKTRIFGLNSN